MGDILTGPSDYDAIRVKLGITEDDLSDAEIATIGLLGVAEALVEQAVSDFGTIMTAGGPNKVFLQAATLSLCAALAVRAIELKRGQSFKELNYSESETKMEWDQTRSELLEDSKSYLLLISTHAHSRQTLLIAGGPTSSASNWPTTIKRWYFRVQPLLIGWLSDNGQMRYDWQNMP